MATLSRPCDTNFWVVAAPSRNFDNVPTIRVAHHEVPLPTYWQILDLVEEGRPENEVVQGVLRHTGTKTFEVVMEIVRSIIENHCNMIGPEPAKSSKRFSVAAFRKPKKQVSHYRASQIEARRESQDAEEKLESARQQERKVINSTLSLSQRKEEIKHMKMNMDERLRMTAEIDHQIKKALQKHHDIEAEINHAKTHCYR